MEAPGREEVLVDRHSPGTEEGPEMLEQEPNMLEQEPEMLEREPAEKMPFATLGDLGSL